MNDFPAAGGIGAYGSDESEDERSTRASDSSDTSDADEEELRHRIRKKQDDFRRKEQERQELEEHAFSNPGEHRTHTLILLSHTMFFLVGLSCPADCFNPLVNLLSPSTCSYSVDLFTHHFTFTSSYTFNPKFDGLSILLYTCKVKGHYDDEWRSFCDCCFPPPQNPQA